MSSIYSKTVCDLAINQVDYQADGKYNKFAAELDSVNFYNGPKNGVADWCSIFVDWLIYKSVMNADCVIDPNVYSARFYLCEPDSDNCGAGCTQAVNYFKAKGLWVTDTSKFKCGDKIFFQKSNGAIYHTGVIIGWGNYDELNGAFGFEVCEGNTNGGMVAVKYYKDSDPKIAGVGSIQYDGWEMGASEPSEPVQSEPIQSMEDLYKKLAYDCIEGYYGNYPDRKHRINALGYGNIYSEVQKRVNLILAGLLK